MFDFAGTLQHADALSRAALPPLDDLNRVAGTPKAYVGLLSLASGTSHLAFATPGDPISTSG